ncbi:DUF4397 domain-containing protein [Blastococcus sp. TBT05-19]|nr:DUF4397 domain-containing protein [Blastococcus sp. TBT05-19]
MCAVLVALLVTLTTALLSPAQAAETGLLRLAHLSPDTPAVDVYVDSVADPGNGTALLTVPGVNYGTISDYQAVPPGVYAISMREAGAAPDSPPALSTTVEIAAGSARTVAGVGPAADLGLEVLQDDLTPPAGGQARVRVVAAAATAPNLDAVAGDASLATDLAFARTGEYAALPAGTDRLTLTAQGTSTEVPIEVAAGSVYSLFVLDRPGGGLTVRTVLDAAGAGAVPVGGVEAGAGGAAGGSSPSGLPVAAALGAGLVGLVAVGVGRRSTAGRHSPSA